jgi:hypothetical protein
MTLNWGHKVMLGFFAFAGMIAYLVFQSMHTKYDLVSKEYYKDELQYQQVIDGTQQANRLSSHPVVSQADNTLIIRLPGEMKQATVTGNIWFYCADNAQKDKKIPLQVNTDAIQSIDSRQFIPGNYTAKINWEANGVKYYAETPITIN